MEFAEAFMKLMEARTAAEAVALLLVIALVWLVRDRQRLIDDIRRKDERIDKIIDDYNAGNMTMADAFNEVKTVLFEIKGKLGS